MTASTRRVSSRDAVDFDAAVNLRSATTGLGLTNGKKYLVSRKQRKQRIFAVLDKLADSQLSVRSTEVIHHVGV